MVGRAWSLGDTCQVRAGAWLKGSGSLGPTAPAPHCGQQQCHSRAGRAEDLKGQIQDPRRTQPGARSTSACGQERAAGSNAGRSGFPVCSHSAVAASAGGGGGGGEGGAGDREPHGALQESPTLTLMLGSMAAPQLWGRSGHILTCPQQNPQGGLLLQGQGGRWHPHAGSQGSAGHTDWPWVVQPPSVRGRLSTRQPGDVLHVPKLARRAGSGGSCQ